MNENFITSAFGHNKEKNFIIYTRQVYMDGHHPVYKAYPGDYHWNEYDRTIAEPIPCYERTRVIEVKDGYVALEHSVAGRDDRGSIEELVYLNLDDISAVSFFEEEKVVLEGYYPALIEND